MALGCMRLEGPELLRAALQAGVRHFDTADVYGSSHTDGHGNEAMLAQEVREHPDAVVVTKVGFVRPPKGRWLPDGRAGHLRAAALKSVQTLGRVDQLLLHFPDPKRSLGTSMRALAKLRDEGRVRGIGVCNVTLAQLRECLPYDLVAVQVPLSVLDTDAIRGGVVGAALAAGLQVQAHSPFGGPKGARRVGRDVTLGAIAERHAVSPYAVALAALVDLGVLPLPGPTRRSTLSALLQSRDLVLEDQDRAALDLAFPALRQLRVPRAVRRGEPSEQQVVVFVGMPGSGKSTASEALVERGYVRLNRDERGGTLKGLLPPLREALGKGHSVVLDNTYASRARRNELIETAWDFGASARCMHFTIDPHEAQINAMLRMLGRYGALEGPKTDPQAFGPMALTRWLRGLEPPEVEEGFESVEVRTFERRPWEGGAAVLVDPEASEPEPGELPVFRLGTCPHGGGPPICWCRPPLPGLLLEVIVREGLDPTLCTLVSDNPRLHAAAQRLGFPQE